MGTKEFPSCQSFLIPLAAGTTSRKRGEQAGCCLGSTHEAGGWEGYSHRWRRLAVLLQMNNAAILTGFRVEQLTVTASCSVQACTSWLAVYEDQKNL